MRIFKKNIMLQLWLVMILLVLTTLWLVGFVQTKVLEQTYYGQHIDQLTIEGEKVVNKVESAGDPESISTLSHILGLNIMIVNEDGYIKECRGMGMDMPPGTNADVFGHHGIPWGKEEFSKIIQGEKLHYIGKNPLIDQDVLSVALPYRAPSEKGMVMVSAPLAPIAERIAILQRVTIYTGFGGILLATLLSLFLSRSVSYPLVKMNKVARAISRGDYSNRLDIDREDEIGVLAKTLNSMSQEIQEKISAIEKLDNARRDFLANVSHELRTPLSVMQACNEALVDDIAETQEERQEYLNTINKEILRLRRLVSEVLDLRKLEAGNIDFEFHPVNISELVQEISQIFNTVAVKKNIRLQTHWEEDLPQNIKANKDKIKQVFVNLMDNAIRVTPEGGEIQIKVENAKESVKFTIKDSGPGIEKNEQELIWERFYKTDKAKNRSGLGTGLGLPMVKRIVEAHGGRVWVESAPGEGAAFIFTVPALN